MSDYTASEEQRGRPRLKFGKSRAGHVVCRGLCGRQTANGGGMCRRCLDREQKVARDEKKVGQQ